MVSYAKYFVVSAAAAAAVMYHAFATRQHFYPTALYLSTSKLAVAVVGNLAFASALLLQKALIRIFLGSLRDIEQELIRERLSSAIMESLLALTVFREEFSGFFVAMFAGLVFVKVLHWLVQDRVDYIEVTPNVSRLQHLRIVAFMSVLLALDALFLQYTVSATIASGGQSVMLLFAFEYVIQASDVIRYFGKYVMSMIDLWLEGRWEGKGTCVFYLDLITDLLHLFVYVVFFIIVFTNYGLPLHLVRDLYSTFRNFRNRIMDFLRFRQVNAKLGRLPEATPQDLSRSDGVCIICREEMSSTSSIKKLPCGHLFHAHCLRSWLERQQNCPTCRAPVFQRRADQTAAAAQRAAQQAGAAAEGIAAAQAAAAAAGVPADNIAGAGGAPRQAPGAAGDAAAPAAGGAAAAAAPAGGVFPGVAAPVHHHHPHVHGLQLPHHLQHHRIRLVPHPAAHRPGQPPAHPAAHSAAHSDQAHVADAAGAAAAAHLAALGFPGLHGGDMPWGTPLFPTLVPPLTPAPGANSLLEQQAAAAAGAAALAAAAAVGAYNPASQPIFLPPVGAWPMPLQGLGFTGSSPTGPTQAPGGTATAAAAPTAVPGAAGAAGSGVGSTEEQLMATIGRLAGELSSALQQVMSIQQQALANAAVPVVPNITSQAAATPSTSTPPAEAAAPSPESMPAAATSDSLASSTQAPSTATPPAPAASSTASQVSSDTAAAPEASGPAPAAAASTTTSSAVSPEEAGGSEEVLSADEIRRRRLERFQQQQ